MENKQPIRLELVSKITSSKALDDGTIEITGLIPLYTSLNSGDYYDILGKKCVDAIINSNGIDKHRIPETDQGPQIPTTDMGR